jgi:hypothetical protein
MMTKFQVKPSIFTVPLALAAHNWGEQFRCHHSHPHKAKQVYLNTLAVFAVNNYLNCQGWITSLETSDSWNLIMQTLMDVADLDLPGYGKLECRFVLPEAKSLAIPPEVWSERIAYVAVKLDNSLQQATLLGFMTKVEQTEIPLSQLKPILDLPAYLETQKQSQLDTQLIPLSQWLVGIFAAGWQKLDQLPMSSSNLCFRSFPQLTDNQLESLNQGITGIKLLQLESCQIVLILNLIRSQGEEMEVSVKICPTNNSSHLPEKLQITILDDKNNPVMQAQAKNTETIEFRFSGESKELFSIKASLNNFSMVENFLL